MLKAEEREIGGLKYKITQLGAVQGSAVLLRLTKALGPALAAIAKRDNLYEALPELLANLALEEADLRYFCDTFAKSTFVFVDSKMPRLDNVFDTHFAGRYLDMLKWLGACVEVNFTDFFTGASTLTSAPSNSEPAATVPS